MKTLITFIGLVLILISCQEQNRNSIAGNWYYVDSDSTYNELYFSNELFVHNLNGAILGPIYFYSENNDSIYLHRSFKNYQKELLFKILSKSKNEVNLIDKRGEKINLLPIEEDLDVWSNINLGEDKNAELIEGWFKRNNMKIYGSSEDTSDFLTVPPVEQYESDTIVH